MSSALRHFFALGLVTASVALGAPGCSQQTEGERCDSAKAGDADCEPGLTCVAARDLLNGGGAERCCPAAGTETDRRCTRGTPSTGTGGSGGASNSGGTSGSGGSTSEPGAAGTPAEGDAGAGGAG